MLDVLEEAALKEREGKRDILWDRMQQTMPLLREDIEWTIRHIPRVLRDLMIENEELWLCGGAIRSCIIGKRISDYDFYTNTRESADRIAAKLEIKTGAKVRKTINTLTIPLEGYPSVQIIKRWFKRSPTETIVRFDFSICQAAIYYRCEKRQFEGICTQAFYPALAGRRLEYVGPDREEAPGGSMLRIIKYGKNRKEFKKKG